MVVFVPPVIPYPTMTVSMTAPDPEPPTVWKNNEVVIKPDDPMERLRAEERRRHDKQTRKAKRVYWRR